MQTDHFSTRAEEIFRHCRDLDVSLNEKLDCFAAAVREISPGAAAAVERLIVRLRSTNAGKNAPGVGDLMPPFVLPDEQGRVVSLAALLEQGPVAVTFHRGHWCPYCRISINALGRAQQELQASGQGTIVAVMPDRQQFAEELGAEAGARVPILTDMDNGYALSLNLMIWIGEEMQEFYARAGWIIPRYQANAGWMLPIPATFVIGTQGRVGARFVDPDYRRRMEIDDILYALRGGAVRNSPTSAPTPGRITPSLSAGQEHES